MNQEAVEMDGTINRNSGCAVYNQLSLKFLSSLISLTTGSICIALVALYHQNEAVLIVMACSTLIYGLSFFAFCLLSLKPKRSILHFKVWKFSCICVQFVTVGASVDYFNCARKNIVVPNTILHNNLLVSLDSLLLFTLFINGLAIGYSKIGNSSNQKPLAEAHEQKNEPTTRSDKFVPLKNSSQTLTPGMEIFQNIQGHYGSKNWNLSEAGVTHSSDEISFPSVVKHKLESLPPKESSPISSISKKSSSISSRLRSASGSTSPKIKNSFIFKLRSSKLKSSLHFGTKGQPCEENDKNKNINGRYVTRLSTIPDLSRSVLNFLTSSPPDDQDIRENSSRPEKTKSQITDSSQFRLQERNQYETMPPDPALELERDAIGRINSALLPPCLRVMETPPPPPPQVTPLEQRTPKMSPLIPDVEGSERSPCSSLNILEKNDLGDIPQIPEMNNDNNSSFTTDFDINTDFPRVVTMAMWEEDKDIILKRAENLERNILLPAFDISKNDPVGKPPDLQATTSFSFPSKIFSTKQSQRESGNNDLDTISALEEYFRDLNHNEEEENRILQDGLKQDHSSPFVAEGVSKELVRTSTRHSPTKSLISIISAASQQRSQTVRSSYLNTNGDSRSYSQNNLFFASSANVMANTTAKSSPTRSQRLRRIGKKLSLSNISDTMINHSITSDTTGELFGTSRQEHLRGKSIDFSYVHNLQSHHSPTKSTSGLSMSGSIYKDRRHSLATDRGLRTASGLFHLQNGNSTIGYDPDVINSTLSEQVSENRKSSHSASTDPSQESATSYPEVVMSEYDRERWNTILSLNMVDSHGELKT